MRASEFDDFDGILGEAHEEFERGKKQGKYQANTYTHEEIEQEGRKFGEQFGEQFAKYEQFVQYYKTIPKENFSVKVNNVMEQLSILLKKVQFKDVDELKHLRRELSRKFTIIMAMLNIKSCQGPKVSVENVNDLDF